MRALAEWWRCRRRRQRDLRALARMGARERADIGLRWEDAQWILQRDGGRCRRR